MRFIIEYYIQRLKTVYYSDIIYRTDTQNISDEFKTRVLSPWKIWDINQTAPRAVYTRHKSIPLEHAEQ